MLQRIAALVRARAADSQNVIGNLVVALQACWKHGTSLESLSAIHAFLVKTGGSSHLPVQNSLLTCYSKSQDLESARHLFDEIPHPDVISWTALIGGYAESGEPEAALRCFREMAIPSSGLSGSKPDGLTLVSVLHACARLEKGALAGQMIHAYAICGGFSLCDVFLGNSLIDMYSKNGDLDSARRVFAEIPVKNLVSWNSLLSGLVHCELHSEALSLFQTMMRDGVPADEVTLVNLLQTCRSILHGQALCRSIHGVVVRSCRHLSNIIVANTILQAYCDCGLVWPAYKLFCSGEKNLVSWSAMMMGFYSCGLPHESISLYRNVVSSGLRPNSVILLGLVQTGSALAELKLLRSIHGAVLRNGLAGEVSVGTALLDGYAKYGEIELSGRVFRSLTEKNVVSWSAMIGALGVNGQPEEALSMFHEMENLGVRPNEITILSLLSACSHGGMVKEGFSLFTRAFTEYSLSPSPEHYSCLADMLARAGDMSEAFEVIKELPNLGAGAWGSLLSACRSYGDCEIGKKALSRLTDLEDSPAPYILASNMYAAGGLRKDSARMRMMVKEKGMRVTPGFSSVSIDFKLHKFVAGDESHPRTAEILFTLRQLDLSMRLKKMDSGEIEHAQWISVLM